MTTIPYQKIMQALVRSKIRFVIAGGVAVNLHQIQRMTVDLDLILHLEPENVEQFGKVIKKLGYQPKVPVSAADFGNKILREKWIKEKGMIVFSYINPDNPFELIDIFVREPMPFKDLYKRSKKVKAFGVILPVLGLADLITLKKAAARPKDLYDIRALTGLLNMEKAGKRKKK